jgi:hypothetical protein
VFGTQPRLRNVEQNPNQETSGVDACGFFDEELVGGDGDESTPVS